MNTLSYSLQLANAAFMGPMRASVGAVSGLTQQLSNVGNIITGFASLPGAIATLVEPFTKPVTLSADLEALETSFKSLLKSAPAAKSMVADLIKFADVTPFDPMPVAATGKALLAFGFAAKSVKPLLQDIGDLAAGMDKPLEEVGDAFGRMKAGQFGEAFEAFRRFGLSVQDFKSEGLVFDKGGSFQGSAEQALEATRRIIRRKFGGGMADLSTTFKGLFSTFSGYWDALQRDFGKPIMQALKPALEDGTGLLKQWSPIAADFGQKIATAITTLRGLFQQGNLTQAIQLGLTIAGKEMVNILFAGINGVSKAFFTALGQGASILQSIFSNTSLMEGLKMAFRGLGLMLKAELLEGAAALADILPGQGKKGNALRDFANQERQGAGQNLDLAGMLIKNADLGGLIQKSLTGMQLTGSAFQAGFQGAGSVLPTGTEQAALQTLLTGAQTAGQGLQSIAEMARAARESLAPLATTRFIPESNPNGITNRRETLLNPQAMERLLNPGAKSDGDNLAQRLADRILNGGPLQALLTAAQRIVDNTNPAAAAGATF